MEFAIPLQRGDKIITDQGNTYRVLVMGQVGSLVSTENGWIHVSHIVKVEYAPLRVRSGSLQAFTKTFPVLTTVTMKMADQILNTHFTDLANMVEDYEKHGDHHRYFLSDGSHIEINKRGVVLHLKNDPDFYGTITLARFAKV